MYSNSNLSLEGLARALGGEAKAGQVLCPGPGHSAKDRSLSVKLDTAASDGFIVHSFAGDDPLVCRDYVRSRAGLPGFKPNGHSRPSIADIERAVMAAATGQSEKPKGKIVTTYDYADAAGKLIYQVVRYEPKDFRQRRPDGKGWIWSLGERRILYRLPELLKFPNATVFVCEGEKDADRVAALGHCATTVAAGKWTDECVAALAGRDLIILQDNDAPGHKKAHEAARLLHPVAKSVAVVVLPDLPAGGDVSDWLDGDPHRAEKLVGICMSAPAWTPPTAPGGASTSEASNQQKAVPTLTSVKASAYRMRGIRWFWRHRFAIGKLGLIGGLPDKGKGLISADMIARATAGGSWPCDEGEAPQGNVIWFTAEDGIEDTIIPRLVAAGADIDRVHIMQMMNNPDGSERMFNLATDLPALENKIEEVGNVVLAIIDPISAYLGVGKINNSSSTDVRGVLTPLTKLAEAKAIALIGIMHFNKKADVTNAMLRIADSLAYVAAARHVYVVVDDTENQHARLFVKAKNNLAPDKYALRYLVGTREVGRDEELDQPIIAPHILWDSEHVEITATQAMEAEENGKQSGAALKEAMDLLSSKLALGPAFKTEIEEEAEANGIADATLRRAKTKLGIKASKEKGEANGKWLWALPTNHTGQAREI